MYEPLLRIDVGEMVNSRFRQMRQEPECLDCQMAFCFMDSPHLAILGQALRGGKRRVCVRLLCERHLKLLNVMFEREQKRGCLGVSFFFLAGGVLYYTLFGLL